MLIQVSAKKSIKLREMFYFQAIFLQRCKQTTFFLRETKQHRHKIHSTINTQKTTHTTNQASSHQT